MKYITSIVVALVMTLNLSAQSSQRIIEFSGTIAGKYPIKMTLNIQNGKVLGYYFYEKHQTKILLAGDIKGDKITLRESPDFEPEFEMGFVGNLKDKVFSGNWIDKVKNKTLNFKVSASTDKQVLVSTSISKLQGDYEDVMNSDKYMGSVSLKHINNNWFCFKISNGTESGCVGYIQALVYLPNLSSGVYSGASCGELKFIFASDTLVVEEKNCEMHGMRCPFTGTYKKK